MNRYLMLALLISATAAGQPPTATQLPAPRSQPAQSAPPALPAGADSLFNYSATRPVELRDSLIEETGAYSVYDISFASPRTGRVTGFLVVPTAAGPHAGIVFGHWGPGNRTEFLPEAKLYARLGAVSIMIDYPWVRPEPWREEQAPGVSSPIRDLTVFCQAVVDLRRCFDILRSRSDVSSSRIAYIGHSYGAQWGAILSAVDKRMKAAILMAGVPSDSVFFIESNDPTARSFRVDNPKEAMDKYMAVSSAIAAIRYVPHAAPVELYFQFARKETEISAAAMERYYRAASEPKRIDWYDTGHELNDPKALIDRAAWLSAQVGIASVKPLFESMLKSTK